MPRTLPVANRLLLGLTGLVLFAAGGAVLAAALGAGVPSWWPWSGPGDVLLTQRARQHWRAESWWWPTVIAALAVLLLLGLWWLLAQFRRSRLAEILVESPDGEVALLRGRALESVLIGEVEDLDGVARARIGIHGRPTAPTVRVRLLLEPYASPEETLRRLAAEALTHARTSAGLEALPAEVRLRAEKHHARRVV
ncbi:alkaline shock response membrane anchor protein AmaP [Streptomyces sp. SCSIO 30461]|uniref:alkaline shock response membrane anchor protein AmaP n=1 Tax=Streptomyces sp. SCSIO 30461 TaxID=3118085 RepID=UPI0030CF5369